MIPQRKPLVEENTDSWLMSYADMITLLLCFFIIFVSVSEPKKERLSQVTNGMAGKFGTVDLSTPFHGVFSALQVVVESNQAFKDVSIQRNDQGVEMELSTGRFFNPNLAEFNEASMPVIEQLVETLKQVSFVDYNIVVEGHTSDVPVESGMYPTNWELSSARASRLVRLLIERGIKPEHIKAVGMADSHPKVPNIDLNGQPIPENREKNARMVIKLERAG